MPRYFFHVHDRTGTCADEEGMILSDDSAARRIALKGARSLMSDDIARGVLDLNGTIAVTDAKGQLILQVRFEEAVLRVC
jgi:hypothetical protein